MKRFHLPLWAALAAALASSAARAEEPAAPAAAAVAEPAKETPAPSPTPMAAPAVTEQAKDLPGAAPVEAASPAAAAEKKAEKLHGTEGPLRLAWPDSHLEISLEGMVRANALAMQPFISDNAGVQVVANPLDTRIRFEPKVKWNAWSLLGDVDFVDGAVTGQPQPGIRMGDTGHPEMKPFELREAYLQYQGATWVARAGKQASQWGLGILANGGAKDPVPGDFGESRFGSLVYRGLLAGRPFFSMGGAWRAIEPAIAIDLVDRDETAEYSAGDRAIQGVFALRFKVDDDHNVGVYGVYRHQRAAGHASDESWRATDAYVADVAGAWKWKAGEGVLRLSGEAAMITGWSTMARSDTAPRSDIRQFGAAVKAGWRLEDFEALLDWGYASGDQNPYDDKLEAFKFAPDYHAGVVLFSELMGFMTARTAGRATDPNVVGYAPDGANLLASKGGVSGATYLFPRAKYSVSEALDVFGGPMFAWTTAKLTDPFNTRLAGGNDLNQLGGEPGSYLGTEFDVGGQARYHVSEGVQLAATLELGWLLPGDALTDASGVPMKPLAAANLRLALTF